jgi:hypothetical protein
MCLWSTRGKGRRAKTTVESRRMRIAGRGGSEVELGVSGWSKVSEVQSLMITKSEEVEALGKVTQPHQPDGRHQGGRKKCTVWGKADKGIAVLSPPTHHLAADDAGGDLYCATGVCNAVRWGCSGTCCARCSGMSPATPTSTTTVVRMLLTSIFHMATIVAA